MGFKNKLIERVMGAIATDAEVKAALLEAIKGVTLEVDYDLSDDELTVILTLRERTEQ